jgi:serine phosphatase RsbU (regulator of sigma subunit)/CHASE2 domain-containing sensor protein
VSRAGDAGPATHVRRIRVWGLIILGALAAIMAVAPAWMLRVQETGFDLYQTMAPRRVATMPATVVAIDDRSLSALGQWPWPRTMLAKLVREIARHDPGAIAIDILMTEPDRLSPERLLDHVEDKDPALAAGLAQLPSNDAALAGAIAEAPVVLALAGSETPTGRTLRAAPVTVYPARASVPPTPRLTRFAGVVTSLDEIDRAAPGHGLISVATSNGVIRRVPLVHDVNGTLAPSLAVEVLRIALRAPALRVRVQGNAVESVAIGDLVIPTEKDGAVRLYYSGRDPRRYVAAVDVLEGRIDPDAIRQKLVVIGTTGLGLVDYQNTALGERMPGPEIQAQLLENIFDRSFLTRPDWAPAAELALFLLLGGALIRATPQWHPRNTALLALGCVAAPAVLGYVAFRWERWLFDAATPAVALLLLFVALLVLTLAEATRRRRSLERMLQSQREVAARAAGELEAAQRIQTGMLPRAEALCGERRIDLATTMVPARDVGGDLYDFFALGPRRLFFLIGDVAGKGLSASIFMAISKALYKSATLRMPDADVGTLMSAVNAEVSRDNPERLFVSAFAGILDLESGELRYCNAGTDDPYLLRPGDRELRRLAHGDGPPLCARDDFAYHEASQRMTPGELVCLVTDGVAEARNRAGAMYGRARLETLLQRMRDESAPAQRIVDALRAEILAFAAGAEASDDLTVLPLRWRGSAAPAQ